MEVNSLVNNIARTAGDDPVRIVTNEIVWTPEIGCGDSTNSIASSMYSATPIGSKLAAAYFIHRERNKSY